MADPIRINGNLVSWGDIRVKVAGEEYTGFTGISFADKRPRTKGYGMGRHQAPLGRSRGKYEIDPVKITGWQHAVQRLREAIAALSADGVSYGDVEVEIQVQYFETADSPLMNVDIERCVWSSNSTSNEEGNDPMKEEIEFDAMLIRRNGLTLFDNVQGVA